MLVTTEYNSTMDKALGPLADQIRKYSLVLSGSFLSSTLHGEFYEGSDVDLYSCSEFKMRNSNEVDSEFDDWIVSQLGGVLVLTKPYVNIGKHNYKYICPDLVINIINVGVENHFEIYDHISRTSDLDICTSTYNGYCCRLIPGLLEKRAKSINEHLINDFDKIEGDEDQKRISRVAFVENFLKKRKSRMVKYRNRGFEIQTDITISPHDEFLCNCFQQRQLMMAESLVQGLRYMALEALKNESGGDMVIIRDAMPLSTRISRGFRTVGHKGEPGFTNEDDMVLLTLDNLKWARRWVSW